jgi:GNAT superfamily N-acetyltransferase
MHSTASNTINETAEALETLSATEWTQAMNEAVRLARESDIAEIMELRLNVRENRLSDPSRVTSEDVLRFIREGEIWVWEEGGRILGFSAGDERDGSIFALFVRPQAEGRGIGRAVFQRACDSLRRAGHRAMFLTTDPGTRAERFYRAAGWRETGRNPQGEIVFSHRLDWADEAQGTRAPTGALRAPAPRGRQG